MLFRSLVISQFSGPVLLNSVRVILPQMILKTPSSAVEGNISFDFNAFNDFLVKINWDKINASLVQLWDVLEPFAENVGTGLLDFFDDFFDKAADGKSRKT